jgi:tRNA threonylcarbamoyladenosine biosynthesis protein TsaB
MPAPTPTPDTLAGHVHRAHGCCRLVTSCWTTVCSAAASASLLPTIEAHLLLAGPPLPSAVIGFGHGPGAFTGLRTSCAVAQGLAFGLGCPVLPIDSLLIVAEQARRQQAPGADDLDVGVVMDARMGETYAARYRWCGGAWQTLQARTGARRWPAATGQRAGSGLGR